MITFSDITDRRQAERALAESERRTRTILETAIEGVLMVDNNAVILLANPALCGILGRTPEDIVGHPVFEFVDEENLLILLSELEKRRKGQSGAYEISLQRSDGVNVPCLFNATPFVDEKGVKQGSFALVTDITAGRSPKSRCAAPKR